jgi:hypothetical protein
MSNKKNITERQLSFVEKMFLAIGKGLRPAIFKSLSKKDPKFAKLVHDLENARADVEKYAKSKGKD